MLAFTRAPGDISSAGRPTTKPGPCVSSPHSPGVGVGVGLRRRLAVAVGGCSRRGVFEVERATTRTRAPTLDDVREALKAAADLASDRDRETFCAAVGIDYRNAAEYYCVVAGMERSLATARATVARATAASSALDCPRRLHWHDDDDIRAWSPAASLADFVTERLDEAYRALLFALHVLLSDAV